MKTKEIIGITLIALVITIIVLLILAGISISMLAGDNSILKRAGEAKDKTGLSSLKEDIQIVVSGRIAEKKSTGANEKSLKEELEEQISDANEITSLDGNTGAICYVKRGNIELTVYDNGEVEEGKYEVWDSSTVECPELKKENNIWNWYIYKPSQLKFLADFVNNGDGVTIPESLVSKVTEAGYTASEIKMTSETTIYLMNNIDLGARQSNGTKTSGIEWIPIGTNIDNVKNKLGTFEGNNNIIKGVYVNREEDDNGIFGSSNTIQNLTIQDSYIKGDNYTGGIVGWLYSGKIENCHNKNTTVVLRDGDNMRAGGIAGAVSGNAINCTNTGSIYGKRDIQQVSIIIGGLFGQTADEVKSCINYGTINAKGAYIGGIVGFLGSKIESCTNYGEILTIGNSNGGIAGYVSTNKDIILCCNNGHIKGNYFIGGIAGFVSDSEKNNGCKIQKNYNCGVVEGVESCRWYSRSVFKR